MAIETSAQEVVDLFNVTREARRKYNAWLNNPDRKHVPAYVMQHKTRVLYELCPADLKRFEDGGVCEHPLGGISKSAATAVTTIKDCRPDFAFTHTLHYALEQIGWMPTYQEFRRFCHEDERARDMLNYPSKDAITDAVSAGYPEAAARKAVRWRVGLSYYSFLREAYVISVLRADGHDVRAHPLADALFRTDAWLGRTVLSIYIRNSQFRDGEWGRKRDPEKILANAAACFSPSLPVWGESSGSSGLG